MSVSSMTGFARVATSNDVCAWAWEAKSVNGKGLDVRLRLPRIFDALEPCVRKHVSERFKRGNISINLDLKWTRPQATLVVNEDVLEQVIQASKKVQMTLPLVAPPTADGILALRGVLEQVERVPCDEEKSLLQDHVLQSLHQMLDQMSEVRDGEGQRLGGVLHDQLAVIETLSEQAANAASLQPVAIRKRLAEQVQILCDDIPALDADRLAQEAAVLMIKADVQEELDRLTAHIAAARDLLGHDDAVGRRLDFLCQEFNREANTLCSKSIDTELTCIGLELKSVIEQFREQVQNIE